MNLNIPLFYYRRHGNNLTVNRKKILEIWDTLPILKKPILDESNKNLI